MINLACNFTTQLKVIVVVQRIDERGRPARLDQADNLNLAVCGRQGEQNAT